MGNKQWTRGSHGHLGSRSGNLAVRRVRGYSQPWSAVGFFAAFAVFCLVFYYGSTFIIPTQANDALTVADLANQADFMQEGSGGYYYTAVAAARLNSFQINLIVFIVGILFLSTIFRKVRDTISVGLAFFLCLSPIFLFLPYFVKDTFTPILCIAALFALTRRASIYRKLFYLALVYIPYGLYFRQYYLLIYVIFALTLIVAHLNGKWRLAAIPLAIACLLLIPSEVFSTLQGTRDWINAHRVWDNIDGNRTAFLNPFPPDNLWHFSLNYGYAILKLNMPILFYHGIKEIFLTINVAIYAYLSWIGIRSTRADVRLPTLLFISHFLVMMIFEPDLGTYLRHLSSVMLFAVPALTLLDRPILREAAHKRSFGHSHQARGRLRDQALR